MVCRGRPGHRILLCCVVACYLQVYAAIKQEIASGGRAYIVCPLVSESDSDAMAGVRTVEEEFARLSGSGAARHTQTLAQPAGWGRPPGWQGVQVVQCMFFVAGLV